MGVIDKRFPTRRRRECLGCGRTMLENLEVDDDAHNAAVKEWASHTNPGQNKYPRSINFSKPNGTFGYGNNGYFCTLTCGFRVAVRRADDVHTHYAPERHQKKEKA